MPEAVQATRPERTSSVNHWRANTFGAGEHPSEDRAHTRGEISGPEPGGRGVFAEVVAEVGQREVDVPVTC